MKTLDVLNAIQHRKGQNLRAVWQREAHCCKGHKVPRIEKRTSTLVRTGIDFANLGSVKAGIEAGEREAVQPLASWQEWASFPFILRAKKGGTEYVRLYHASFANKPHVEWLLEGRAVPFSEVEPYLLASEKPKEDKEASPCFQVKCEDLLSIGPE